MKCRYPKCEKETEYSTRKGLHLCEEHYRLFQFLDRVLLEASIAIDLRKSIFDEERVAASPTEEEPR